MAQCLRHSSCRREISGSIPAGNWTNIYVTNGHISNPQKYFKFKKKKKNSEEKGKFIVNNNIVLVGT